MAYVDRDYNEVGSGGGGKWSRLFGRVVENPENPLGWSVKMFRFRGITARIHLVTILYMLVMIVSSIAMVNMNWPYMLMAMTSLFVVVLAHEFGHCFACRWSGGEADRIVMLPFGGLALCHPVNEWKANFITAAGGPAVNVVLAPLTIGALFALGLGDFVLFNPMKPGIMIGMVGTERGLLGIAVWFLHYTNLVIFAFNVLLPMFPFDGGRMIQTLVWKKKGYRKSMELAVTVGYAGAILMGVIAVVMEGGQMLLAIAVFGGWACWMEKRRLTADAELAEAGYGVVGEFSAEEGEEDSGATRAEAKALEREARDQGELDRLLAKISGSGMESLSRGERKSLDRMTKKRRDG